MIREFLFRTLLLETAGERARRLHGAWLTRALTDSSRAYPRIPVRPVHEGGFAAVTATVAGRAWADGWWGQALERVE
jgi:hypothetical protein